MELVEVQDAVNFVIVREEGTPSNVNLGSLAYPDICSVECPCCWCVGCYCADDEDCYGWHASLDQLADKQVLKQYARHLGGVDLGYLDGHASWINSQALISKHAEPTNNMGGWSPEMKFATATPVGDAVPDDCGFPDQRLYY